MDGKLALVEWEDIIAHQREPLPDENGIKDLLLVMETVGYVIHYLKHVVVVSDYDVTNDGRDYCHNTFTIIPRGVLRKITYLAKKPEVVEHFGSGGDDICVTGTETPADGGSWTNKPSVTDDIETK